MATELKLKSIDHHRNGICGLPFYILITEEREPSEKKRDMLVLRFEKDLDKRSGQVACVALNLALLDQRNIAFFENSWRGDHYADFADKCIEELHADKIKPAYRVRREAAEKARAKARGTA